MVQLHAQGSGEGGMDGGVSVAQRCHAAAGPVSQRRLCAGQLGERLQDASAFS